jgi:hypothetical protein
VAGARDIDQLSVAYGVPPRGAVQEATLLRARSRVLLLIAKAVLIFMKKDITAGKKKDTDLWD